MSQDLIFLCILYITGYCCFFYYLNSFIIELQFFQTSVYWKLNMFDPECHKYSVILK